MRTLSRRSMLAGMMAASIHNVSQAATPKRSFPVFDGLLHTRKPSSQQLGLEPVVAVSNIWRFSSQQQQVDESGIARALAQIPHGTKHIYYDIECWPLLRVDRVTRDESIKKFIRVAEFTRTHNPSLMFGFYNILPAHTYWPLVSNQFAEEYAEWQSANHALAPLGRLVDYIFPSLYTYYADRSGWNKQAAALLDAAREFEKPILPFVWYEYHDSNQQLRDREIDAPAWQEELQFCRTNADGVVLWGGYRRHWSEQASWWRTAKSEFGIRPI